MNAVSKRMPLFYPFNMESYFLMTESRLTDPSMAVWILLLIN